jgi:hypothetical protein
VRAAETLLWVFGAIAAAMTLAAMCAALTARGSNGKRPVPPEMGDDIHRDGEPFTDEHLAWYVAKWRKDHRRG